jgi:hypothetical protein
MFLADGDGVVFLGDEGRWYSERRGDYHLNGESAERLLRGVLATYQQQHGKELNEVFLHCRSTINEEEFEGYQASCVPGVKLVAIRVATLPPSFRKSPGQRGGHRPGRGSRLRDDASLRPRALHDDRSTRPM